MEAEKPSEPPSDPRPTDHDFLGVDYVFYPYELNGCIVFDDPKFDLKAEEFVCGADTLIRRMVQEDAEGASDYYICVSAEPQGAFRCLIRIGSRDGGEIYECEYAKETAWFCPSFYNYYPSPPPVLYVRAFASRPGRAKLQAL